MFAEAVDVLLAMVPNPTNRSALVSHGRIHTLHPFFCHAIALYSSCFLAYTPTPLNLN